MEEMALFLRYIFLLSLPNLSSETYFLHLPPLSSIEKDEQQILMRGEEQNVPGHGQSRPPALDHILEFDHLPPDTSRGNEVPPSTPTQSKEVFLSEKQPSTPSLAPVSDTAIAATSDNGEDHPGNSAGSSSSASASMGNKSKLHDKLEERQAKIYELSHFLYSVHKNMRTLPVAPLITELGSELVSALNDAANFGKFKDPELLSYAADITARFSDEPASAAALADKDYLSVLEGVLKTNIPSSSSPDVRSIILGAWCDAAHAVRNIAEASAETARTVARETELVKLIIHRIEYDEPGPSPHVHHSVGALANIARHGNIFKTYIRKHGGIPAVAAHAKHNTAAKVRFESLRFLSEFSTCPKWIPHIISESVIVPLLMVIAEEESMEIASEAATFIGNMASDDAARDEIIKEQGVIIITNRLEKWGRSLPGTLVLDFKYTPDDESLPLELLRAIGNLCYENDRAARTVVDGFALMALISGYDENASGALDGDMKKQLKDEALRGLLVLARVGHNFTVETMRQIGIRIRHDSVLGRSTNYLFDLMEKMKNTLAEEEKIPQTTEELGRAAEKYTVEPRDVVYKSEADSLLFSEAGQESKQPPTADPKPERYIRVQRPDKNSTDLIPQAEMVDSTGSTLFSQAHKIMPSLNNRMANLGQDSMSSSSSNSVTSNETEYGVPPHGSSGSRRRRRMSATFNESGVRSGPARTSKSTGHRPTRTINISTSSAADTLDEMEEDHYRIGSVLGRGAFATVYLAKNLLTGEFVAVKRLLPPVADTAEGQEKSEQAARKVVKEQRITRKLQHKNVVSYKGCFFGERGELNLIAEYVPGWSLSDHLIQIGKFPEHMVARITRQIVDGLEYLHGEGVVHRDLQPSNLLVNPSGVIKITDFGVSSASDVQSITQGTVVGGGGAWYVTPEIILNEPRGKPVDIWALGCTVYELACGRRPYYNLEHSKAIIQLAKDRHPPIPSRFSYNLEKFIKKCWIWEPEKRPTVAELRELDFLKYIV